MSNVASLRGYFDHARALADRLCRQPSVAADGLGMEAMADLTETALRDTGFTTRRFFVNGAPPAIWGEQRGRSAYTLLLYNHYDVQPAEPLSLWDSPPFDPISRDGKLYARGIADNKGEIAARLAAIQALRDLEELPITVRWVIEGEEEVGSPHFGDIIAPHASLLHADGCFWEGTGFDSKTDRPLVGLGTKGMLYVELSVECLKVDAHSAAAAILPSAAWRLLGALAAIRTPEGHVRIPGFYDPVRDPTPMDQAALADQSDVEQEMREMYGIEQFSDELTGVALRERNCFSPTCNIAGITSGYTGAGMKTVLPARAMTKIDFRLVPDQAPMVVAQALRTHLDNEGYDDVHLTVLGSGEPVRTAPDHPFVQRVLRGVATFNGKPPQVTPMVPGTLPLLGPLRQLVGVPGLMPPTNVGYWGSKTHAPNEHIRLSDLDRAVASAVHLLRGLATS